MNLNSIKYFLKNKTRVLGLGFKIIATINEKQLRIC